MYFSFDFDLILSILVIVRFCQGLIQENNLRVELSWGVYENFFGIQRPLEWLKVDSNLTNDGFMTKLKSSMEFKESL